MENKTVTKNATQKKQNVEDLVCFVRDQAIAYRQK